MAVTQTGSVTTISASRTGSQSITVPSDAELCVVMPAWWSNAVGSWTITLGGQSVELIATAGAAGGGPNKCGAYRLASPPTGSQTLAWTFSESSYGGIPIFVAFFKGLNTTTPIRGYGTGDGYGFATITSSTFSSSTDDLCICIGVSYMSDCNAAPTGAGQTELSNHAVSLIYGAVGSKGGVSGTTTMKCDGSDPSIVAFSIAAAAAGPSGNPWYYYAQQLRSLKDKWRCLLQIPSLEEVKLYGSMTHA